MGSIPDSSECFALRHTLPTDFGAQSASYVRCPRGLLPGGGGLHSRGVRFNTKLHILPKVKKAQNSSYNYT